MSAAVETSEKCPPAMEPSRWVRLAADRRSGYPPGRLSPV